jgi:mevalonate kinase
MAVATIRGLLEFLGHPLSDAAINKLAFECEKYVHSNPSGVDNTVITYEEPVFYQKGQELVPLKPVTDLHFVLADSGIQKSTSEIVTGLAERYQADTGLIKPKIESIGQLANYARRAIETGNLAEIAEAINQNQRLLSELDLSCPELDHLVNVALESGALAAKLTGGGKGGHILALVEADRVETVLQGLISKGALNPFHTVIKGLI